MKFKPITATIVTACLLMWLPSANDARAAEVKVLSTIGVRSVLQVLSPEFEKATGHTLVLSFDVANALKRRIDAGENFDVAILTVPVMEELIKQGKIVADTRVIIARGGMGVAVRAGVPRPDISTTEAFKRTLVNAKSIAYPKEGLTGLHMSKVIAQLGITEVMTAKSTLTGAGSPAELVAKGEVEMAVHIIPELLAAPGVDFIGPLPSEVQTYIVLPGGVSTSALQSAAGHALLKFLTGPAVVPVIRSKGYEPGN